MAYRFIAFSLYSLSQFYLVVQLIYKKKRRESSSLKADKLLDAFLIFFNNNCGCSYVWKKPKTIFSRETSVPQRNNLSGEAYLHLVGYVNEQNCRIWGSENPQVFGAASATDAFMDHTSLKITTAQALDTNRTMIPSFLPSLHNISVVLVNPLQPL